MKELGYCEGDACGRSRCAGVIQMRRADNCSCHLNAPCSACMAPRQHCSECGWDEADEPTTQIINDFVVKVDRQTGVYQSWAPRPLDPTKIDWRSEGHTHFTMIKEGVYPKGVSREEVEKAVRGTFGGRFSHFGDGKFKYIAHTD